MKIKELKESIKNLSDDMEVILQRDSEGNGYSPALGSESDAVYIPDDNEVYVIGWGAEGSCKSADEWEEVKERPRVLLIYPLY